jgi:preprotein translocase subunit SecB
MTDETNNETQAGTQVGTQDEAGKRISITKVYLKDFSFESPQAPGVFRSGEWKPQTNLNLRSAHNEVDGDLHEVVLTITVDAKDGETSLFLAEIQQSGLFEIAGYDKEEFGAIVGSFCPNILFPYARETIASIIQKGGFPEFVLQPINFDALYMQSRQQAAQQEAEGLEKH